VVPALLELPEAPLAPVAGGASLLQAPRRSKTDP
jgi:hypothetical protein